MEVDYEEGGDMEILPLEYVIHLGANGNHILFEKDRIREAFRKDAREFSCMGAELVHQVREAINEVMSIPDFEGKKDFISTLPEELQDVLIHLYFQMVEKTLLLDYKQLH